MLNYFLQTIIHKNAKLHKKLYKFKMQKYEILLSRNRDNIENTQNNNNK